MLPGQTVWLKPSRGEKAAFADVTLRRSGLSKGSPTTARGGPSRVPSCSSRATPIRTRTVTDLKGHFQLPGVIEGKAILFARKNGFRLQGQPIDTEAGAAKLELTRSDETPVPLATLASVLPRHEELALAQRLLAPYVDQVMLKGNDREKFQALASMAPIDPSRVLELIETKGLENPCSLWTASARSSPPDWLEKARTRR